MDILGGVGGPRVSALGDDFARIRGTSPSSIFKRVDLPVPFRPRSPIRSPASIGSVASSRRNIMNPNLQFQCVRPWAEAPAAKGDRLHPA